MPSTKSWWTGTVDWGTPAGQLLRQFAAALPPDREFRFTLYGSAPLQLTLDPHLLSGDVDLFSDDDEDLAAFLASTKLDKAHGGLHLEAGFELSFRTSPRWRMRAATVPLGRVTFTIPHPLDILIGKLGRLETKDLKAFEVVIRLTGHPTEAELLTELQFAVDLFRPGFDESMPNEYFANSRVLWREVFHKDIDVRQAIIQPALAIRRAGYGEAPPNYKADLGAEPT